MARQRNNIARMPWEIRETVCRMLFAGATNAEIDAAVQAECERLGCTYRAVHGSSLQAYSDSAEYRRYCDRAREWNERLEARRWAAGMINQGRGPQSIADIAEVEILEQLHDLAAGGLLETGKDVATVARAITALQRTQLARAEAAKDDTIARLKAEYEAKLAAKDADVERLTAQIARLRATVEQKQSAVDPDDRQRLIEAFDEYVGKPQH